jgi:cell wall-associated NlpC family hydrolase
VPNDRLRSSTRKTVHAAVAAAFAVSLTGTLVAAAPAGALPTQPTQPEAKPKIDTVKAKVAHLFHEAEIAGERYDTARLHIHDTQTTLAALQSDLLRQQGVVEGLREQVASSLVEQYQGQSISTAGQVALSGDPSAFIDGLSAMSAYNDQRSEVMQQYTVQLSRLNLREKAVSQEASALAKTKTGLAQDKAVIDKKAAAAKAELDSLEAKQRNAILSGDYTGGIPTVDATGNAATAIHYALAQVGKAYVWGAAGPSAFDCSGLMMRAWGAAGVGLPHSSRAQAGYGTPVASQSDLQPGDLVFYYHPISHVGMYIGGGLIVNAENPSVGVKITGLNSMPYAGAVHLG